MKWETVWHVVCAAVAVIGAAVVQALGGWDTALQALTAVMAVDYVTGVLCALVWHKSPKSASGAYDSRAGLKGLLRKGAILSVVVVATCLDRLSGTDVIRTATVLFFLANEGLSVVENLGLMGLPLPTELKRAFEMLKK